MWLIHYHRYGGYDGYHVYNDVAVLDTRTWSWTIKNTNAAVQGRADVSLNLSSGIMENENEKREKRKVMELVAGKYGLSVSNLTRSTYYS